jgi:Mrp family chromosome partitioning ATPase
VIDGPPVLEASHAKILAQQATEIVFLVEWDKTSQASVKEALNRLDGDAKLLLLNKIDVTRYRLFDPDQSRSLAAQIEELRRAA